jgi:putative peptidoglycan lipid II flippase
VVVHVLARAFYAMQDTWTPVIWAVVAVVANIVLMLVLVEPMGVEGLALALSISATLEVAGLLVALRRSLGTIDGRFLLASVARSSAATVAAAVAMLATLFALDAALPALSDGAMGRLMTLLVPAAAGGLAYLAAAYMLRAHELVVLRRLYRRSGSP